MQPCDRRIELEIKSQDTWPKKYFDLNFKYLPKYLVFLSLHIVHSRAPPRRRHGLTHRLCSFQALHSPALFRLSELLKASACAAKVHSFLRWNPCLRHSFPAKAILEELWVRAWEGPLLFLDYSFSTADAGDGNERGGIGRDGFVAEGENCFPRDQYWRLRRWCYNQPASSPGCPGFLSGHPSVHQLPRRIPQVGYSLPLMISLCIRSGFRCFALEMCALALFSFCCCLIEHQRCSVLSNYW